MDGDLSQEGSLFPAPRPTPLEGRGAAGVWSGTSPSLARVGGAGGGDASSVTLDVGLELIGPRIRAVNGAVSDAADDVSPPPPSSSPLPDLFSSGPAGPDRLWPDLDPCGDDSGEREEIGWSLEFPRESRESSYEA